MAKRQIEIPVNNNTHVTSRSLKETHPDNQNMYESSLEFQELLKEVKIRFDTNPHFYLREDYLKLIELIRKKSGYSDITVNISGSGNVVTNVSYKDGILTIDKGNAEDKEYFPDYAFWQKNYIKKGGECLWIPDTITPTFPINRDKTKNLWLEIARADENGLFHLSADLLRKLCHQQEEIEFRFGITDLKTEDDTVYINDNTEWSLYNYGRLTLPSEDVLAWVNELRDLTLYPDSFKETQKILYINLTSYFSELPDKTRFYIIKWDKDWTITELSLTEIKCKYHQLLLKLYNQDNLATVSRNTWREYPEPEVTINTLTDVVKRDVCTISNDLIRKSEKNLEKEKNNPIYFEFVGATNNRYDYYPANANLPDVYFTYERKHRPIDRHYTKRTRTTFEWCLFIHGDKAHKRRPVFYEMFLHFKYFGNAYRFFKRSVWHHIIGQPRHGSYYKYTVYVRIPYGCVLKSQSPSWSVRSKRHYLERLPYPRDRYKVFYKYKTACLRVCLMPSTEKEPRSKLVSIVLDKIPFIMPKICY